MADSPEWKTLDLLATAFYGRIGHPLSDAALAILRAQSDITIDAYSNGRGVSWGSSSTSWPPRRDLGVSLVVSCINSTIFSAEFLSAVSGGVVNLHPAPLPEYRGCFNVTAAARAGARDFGVTLHYCDSQIDTGPIVAQTTFPIEPGTPDSVLTARVVTCGCELLGTHLPAIITAARHGARVPAIAQDETRAHYYSSRA